MVWKPLVIPEVLDTKNFNAIIVIVVRFKNMYNIRRKEKEQSEKTFVKSKDKCMHIMLPAVASYVLKPPNTFLLLAYSAS